MTEEKQQKDTELTEAKEKKSLDDILELITVVMLGVTALLTAWAGWISSLHGGNQATSYTTSNNLASEGNSEYNAAIQTLNQDMSLWNDISDMQMEISFAQEEGDDLEAEKVCYQLFYKLNENLSEDMANAIGWPYNLTDEQANDPVGTVMTWLETDEAYTSPFFDEEYVNSYLTTANELLAESQEELEKGQEANSNGDAFGLVTVIYSVVLFLLGIVGTFKNSKNRVAIVAISCVAFVVCTIYMLTLPMPDGFSLGSFFGA